MSSFCSIPRHCIYYTYHKFSNEHCAACHPPIRPPYRILIKAPDGSSVDLDDIMASATRWNRRDALREPLEALEEILPGGWSVAYYVPPGQEWPQDVIQPSARWMEWGYTTQQRG